MELDQITTCPHQTECSGCQFLGISYNEQILQKKSHFQHFLKQHQIQAPEVDFVSVGQSQLRDRLDFVYEEGRFGLYNKQKNKIVDINSCSQLSPALHEFYLTFKKIKWPIRKGSFRLRNKNKNFGVWLDFANLDIKSLLDQKSILEELSKIALIEIGRFQKTYQNGRLGEPQMKDWFTTAGFNGPASLDCFVSSFTQPSQKSNLKIIQLLLDYYKDQSFKNALEWGSGIGNLTLPVSDLASNLVALEINSKDILCLTQNIHNWGIQDKVQIHEGDFQKKTYEMSDCDLLILNPARSGLGEFTKHIPTSRSIFLMSCFTESWARDVEVLQQKGYSLDRIYLVDQFPQTNHYEILSFLS